MDVIEEYFRAKEIRYRRREDEIELTFYGYPVAERYRVLYLLDSDAVLISSHGIAYPSRETEANVVRKIASWNHDSLGACWSFDPDRRAVCADTTLYLGGSPLDSNQFDRHFNGMVSQVRRRLPELLRLVVDEPVKQLDPAFQAELERILVEHDEEPGDSPETTPTEEVSDDRDNK